MTLKLHSLSFCHIHTVNVSDKNFRIFMMKIMKITFQNKPKREKEEKKLVIFRWLEKLLHEIKPNFIIKVFDFIHDMVISLFLFDSHHHRRYEAA